MYLSSRPHTRGSSLFAGNTVAAASYNTGLPSAASTRPEPLVSSLAPRLPLNVPTGVPSTDELIDVAITARELADRSDPLLSPSMGPLPSLSSPTSDGSTLRVGAALLARSGRVYTGCSIMVLGTNGIGSSVDASMLSSATPLHTGLPSSTPGSMRSSGGPVHAGMAGALQDGVVPAEQVVLLKALSEGEREFLALILASDHMSTFPQPTAVSARFLLSYGDFPVFLVRNDRSMVQRRLGDLAAPVTSTPAGISAASGADPRRSADMGGMADGGAALRSSSASSLVSAHSARPTSGAGAMPVASPSTLAGAGTGPASIASAGAAAASDTGAGAGDRDGVSALASGPGSSSSSSSSSAMHETLFGDLHVGQWTVAHVCSWLDRCCDLPQYQHRFREASVDGPLLLSLHDTDLQHLLSVSHPLHRRKIELGIARLAARDAQERASRAASGAPRPLPAGPSPLTSTAAALTAGSAHASGIAVNASTGSASGSGGSSFVPADSPSLMSRTLR